MTEPTLTELREIATKNLAWLDGLSDDTRAVLRAFLAMTDPEPLNVLQAQSLGLEQDDENEHEYVDGDNPTSLLAVMMGRDHVAIKLRIGDPTVGQLRLALMQENCDGE